MFLTRTHGPSGWAHTMGCITCSGNPNHGDLVGRLAILPAEEPFLDAPIRDSFYRMHEFVEAFLNHEIQPATHAVPQADMDKALLLSSLTGSPVDAIRALADLGHTYDPWILERR